MKHAFTSFAAALLVMAAVPALAVDDTNYGARVNVITDPLPPNVHTSNIGQCAPVWSPDGKTIAFTDAVGMNIYTVPVDGGQPTLIYNNKGKKIGYIEYNGEALGGGMTTLGFTPDGKGIIFRDDMVDTARGSYIGPYDFPPTSYDPDGRHEDFVVLNMICIIMKVDIATGATSILADEAQDGLISPDGRYLAYSWFASGDDQGKKYGVKILDLQTGENRLLADTGTSPCFTPDSKYVIFSMVCGTTLNLCQVPITGGISEQITRFSLNEDDAPESLISGATNPKVSPDGEWVLFQWRRWHPEIPAMITRLGAFNLKTGESFKVFPNAEISIETACWSPDGKKFVYQTEDRRVAFYDRNIFISDFPPATYSKGTGVAEALPAGFSIAGNRPNPFNPSTVISFSLPKAGAAALTVYDITGRMVRELTAGSITAGVHSAVWDGRDSSGRAVSSGVYLARLSWNGTAVTHRMTLMK